MLKKLLLAGAMLIGAYNVALPQGTPQTRANMTSEITTLFPSGGTPVNAANLRTAFYDLIQSISALYHDAVVNMTGALVLGTPTGGSKGPGTLNAQGIFLNGAGLSSLASQPTNFTSFGTPGSSDDTPAFNAFITACANNTANHECLLNPGLYNFTSRPACLHGQLQLHGDTLGGVVLVKNYNESDSTKGIIRICDAGANDSTISRIGLYGQAGTTGGTLIEIVQASPGSPIGFITFRDINISTLGNCTQDYGIYENGSVNTVAPIGTREIVYDNVSVFGANIFSVSLNSAVGVVWSGGSLFPAGCGSSGTGAMNVGGTVAVNSTDIMATPLTIQGGLVLSQTNSSTFMTNTIGAIGGVSIVNTSTVDHVVVRATSLSGIAESNWTNSSCTVATGAAC